MKTKTLTIIGVISLGVFILSHCESDGSLLSERQSNQLLNGVFSTKNSQRLAEGNYVVDDNYLIKSTAEISKDDMKKLMLLDKKYADLTKGRTFLHYIVNTQKIKVLTHIQDFDRISRIQKINFIYRGCFEKAQIDWKEFGDLKSQLDRILEKYSPQLINENISITDNQIATKAIRIEDRDMSKMSGMSIYGFDDANICGDYMGVNKFSRLLYNINSAIPNQDLNIRLNEIIKQYQ
jgi:hypothetical protein